ncbi:MAG: septum formation initiator family protein [Desulfobacterales bacterium]|nr:MAG: septum formation initiator family protein [Desulfobacterales bacterium]
MTKNQSVLLSITILFLIALFFFIIVSEHGLLDLRLLKQEKAQLVQENVRLTQENLANSIIIDRLKNDPAYIENIARHELGMIGESEIILKPQH